MASFSKDKISGKWYCSDCGQEIPKEIIMASYNYFGENKEHHCAEQEVKASKILNH